MGFLSSIFSKGQPCPRCGQKSPLLGKGSRWEAIGSPKGGTLGGYRCRDCGTALQTDAHAGHGPPSAPAPSHAARASASPPSAQATQTAPPPVHIPDNSIHMAADVGDATRVQMFLSRGESVASPDPIGLQPLHYASNRGRIAVMQLLIDHGADPNAQGEQGLAPLHGSAYHGSLEGISFLVEHGADVNIRTSKEFTPLKIARFVNQHEAAALLERLGGVE